MTALKHIDNKLKNGCHWLYLSQSFVIDITSKARNHTHPVHKRSGTPSTQVPNEDEEVFMLFFMSLTIPEMQKD